VGIKSSPERNRYERELLAARKNAEELLSEKTSTEVALRQTKAELRLAYEQSQRRALFAEQMVAIASHDLKNPLTAIKMATDFLAREERSTKATKLLELISQSSDRAQRMIADLLDLALVRVGLGIGISPRPIDLHKVVSQTLNELHMAFPRAVLRHQSAGEGAVELDADRMQQMIGNRVANSVAYGDLSQPITIRSILEDGVAIVSVYNSGPEIPRAAIGSLFEPMTRNSERDDDVKSVGLGLFIVKEIARAHGGEVTVASNTSDGTIFQVSIPTPVGAATSTYQAVD